MELRIDSATISQSGKSYAIKSGGETYYCKPDQGIHNAIGRTIEAEVNESVYNGNKMKWINAYKLIGTSGTVSTGGGSNPPVQSDVMKFMPFVSNTVNAAIRGGFCTEPNQIGQWAKAAYQAAIALESIAEFREEL